MNTQKDKGKENGAETKNETSDKIRENEVETSPENSHSEDSHSSDKQPDSKEHVSEPEEKVVSDKNSNAENHTDSQKNAGSNTEKTESTNGESTSKEKTKSESSENHSAKENGSTDGSAGKETASNGNEGANSQSHDTQKSESGVKTEEHHVDNTDYSKSDAVADSSNSHHDNGNKETGAGQSNSEGNNKTEGIDTQKTEYDNVIEEHHNDGKVNGETEVSTHKTNADSEIDSLSGKKNNDIDITGEKTKIDADVDTKVELSDASKKIIQLYEKVSGEKVDVETSVNISKGLNKCSKAIDLAGNTLDLIDGAVAIYKAVNLYVDGDTNGACKVLSDYGFSTLASMGTGALAMAIIGLGTVNPILGFAFVLAMGYQGAKWGEEFSDWWFREVLGLYDEAGAYTYPVDPLIFDLNGNGIETISVKDGVNFDFDKNGFAEKIGWVSAEDGLLVHDLNKDGKISSGRELMGDLTELTENSVASNGFQAIGYYDENRDGVINSNDAIYSELKIWQDKNQNALYHAILRAA